MYAFNVRNLKAKLAGLPQEDSYAFNEQGRIACVADLVTRDFSDGSVFSRDLKGLVKASFGMYPNYSYASDICTRAFMATKSLAFANERIGNYNSQKGLIPTNYLDKDFAGCTAAGFWEEKGLIHCSFIADSRILVIDKNGIKFKTPDEGPHSEGRVLYLESRVRENGGWNNSEARRVIRRDYRNNPNQGYFSFGVLTGEKNAERYIDERLQPVKVNDYVLVFTDGITDIAFNKKNGIELLNSDFYNLLVQDNSLALRLFCQERVHSEGTLVVHKVEKD